MVGGSRPAVLQGCGFEQDQQTQETGKDRAAVQQGKSLLVPYNSPRADLAL